MRVQHNIMAMNSYRNYNNNTNSLSKNLEKLSSGYKINRAGDDAAGLAISEKMRAQITGLETAQSNAKSGINLVQTAEGSLTEVHDMLNRMVKLADQSANGTYDNETDRANLQKEVSALKSEIDRIADSSNFNGINLLDGSLDGAGSSTSNKLVLSDLALKDTLKTSDGKAGVTTAAGVGVVDDTAAADHEFNYTFTFDNNGVEETHTLKVSIAKGDTKIKYSMDGGDEKTATAGVAAAGKLATGELAAGVKEALEGADWFKDLDITVAVSTEDLKFTNNNVGTDQPTLTSVNVSHSKDSGTAKKSSLGVTETTAALDKVDQLDLDKLRIASGATKATAASKVFEVNGRKFAILDSDNADSKASMGLSDDVITIKLTAATGITNVTGAEAKAVMDEINKVVGSNVFSQQQDGDKKLSFSSSTNKDGSGKGLSLQIGDTADTFNQVTVSVGDMHTKALGIGGIDISTQDGGKAAVEQIKTAINSVSSTRGDLGALQNRLDHTIKNLSVMQENIQDAEANIRDTDVAAEMMTYTKNNILVQSAQAMLAQANQVPQGVLQLLQ